MENAYQSIGLFIDGGYYAKVNEALAQQASLNIDMGSLMYLVRQQVARIGGHVLSDCHITESHYFRGRYRVYDANNKHLLISRENIKAARYEKKAAFTNFLPNISAAGGYMRSSRELSLLSDAQKGALSGIGTTLGTPLQQAAQALGQLFPELGGQLSALGESLTGAMNSAGSSLVDAFRTDTRNMYAGALTLTQPLYMGGKIRAYNKITRYAEELARQQHNSGMQEVILSTDQAYWQVVSLANKKKLA